MFISQPRYGVTYAASRSERGAKFALVELADHRHHGGADQDRRR
jgi:hypothetical protein